MLESQVSEVPTSYLVPWPGVESLVVRSKLGLNTLYLALPLFFLQPRKVFGNPNVSTTKLVALLVAKQSHSRLICQNRLRWLVLKANILYPQKVFGLLYFCQANEGRWVHGQKYPPQLICIPKKTKPTFRFVYIYQIKTF